MSALLVAVACLLVLLLLTSLRIWIGPVYLVVGVALWVAMVESGVHPTLAGMAMGLMVSAYPPRPADVERAAALARAFRQSPVSSLARSAKMSVERAVSPNERLQEALHPWTSYGIVPVFALANAGVDLRGGVLGHAFSSPVTWGVIVGLVGGKLIGIAGTCLTAARLGLGRLPRGVGPGQVLGGAALSGIGFTVSLLVLELGIETAEIRAQAQVGVLAAAVLATLLGWVIFRLVAALLGEGTRETWTLSPPIDIERDHIRGPNEARLTLLEFADFECRFCGPATGVIRELRLRFGDELRYVFRHLPLTDIHPHAELAAEASEAAAAQGCFWEYHDILFEHQDHLEAQDLLGYASQLDLDVERFALELRERVYSERVREDVASAEASGARGTPTFFIGHRRHTGAFDTETLAHLLGAK